MALYERLISLDDAGNPVPNQIPGHLFETVAAEWARGKITGAQANAIIAAESGAPLDATELIDAQAIVDTVPTGNTTANKADRALRLIEIEGVLLLGNLKVEGYNTPTQLRAKLGL